MNIRINLASEPFRRDRLVLMASAVGAVALAALLALMITMIFQERGRMAETRATIDGLNAQLAKLNAEQAQVDATLRQPENAEVLERSLLLNTLLERKGISWTRIFADLEKVMPHNVRLISVRLPQINSQNEVLLDMVVGAQAPEPVIDFLKRLGESPLFGAAAVHTYLPPSQNEPLHRYRVSVNYGQKL